MNTSWRSQPAESTHTLFEPMSELNSDSRRLTLPADDVEEIRGSLTELDSETLENRRASLKTMLDTSVARYDQAMSRRLPCLAPGVQVRIVRGRLQNQTAVVREADYIAERALIEPSDAPPQWVRFGALGPAPATKTVTGDDDQNSNSA